MDDQKVRELAPTQWEKLKTTLKAERDRAQGSSPVHFAIEYEGSDEMSVTNLRNGKVVLLRYQSEAPVIEVKVGERSGSLKFRLASDKHSVQLMEGHIPRSVGEISVNLIRRIL